MKHLDKRQVPNPVFRNLGLEYFKKQSIHLMVDNLSEEELDSLFTTKVYDPNSEEGYKERGHPFLDNYTRDLYARLEMEDSVLIQTKMLTLGDVREEGFICSGCGHVKGDRVGDALGCCPDSKYLPLREFIKDWHDLIVKKAMKIIKLEGDRILRGK